MISSSPPQIKGRSGLNRRQMVQRAIAVGLVPPIAARMLARDVAAAPGRQVGFKGGYGTMIAAIAGEPVSFNLNVQPDEHALVAARNIFSSLVTFDRDYAILPDLAQRWSISDDGLLYTFTLDRGATWHDGEQVTSADVRYTLDRILATETAPAYGRLAAIAEIETPNDMTVELTLSAPSASLLGALAAEGAFILPAHLYEGTDWATNEANQAPVGSGPFRFLSYTPGGSIDLGTFPEYFGLGPYLDQLLLQIIPEPASAVDALLNGEVDLITSSLPAAQIETVRQVSGFAVGEQARPTVWFLGFNLEREPTANRDVRLALSQAIDREHLVAVALSGLGTPATTFLPALLDPARSEDTAAVPDVDGAAAAAALDDAGLPVDDGTRLTLTMPYVATDTEQEALALALREQLPAVNIDLDLVALEHDAWRQRLADGDFDLTLVSGPPWPDPSGLRDLVGTGGSDNHWRYSNPEVDALIEDGEALIEAAARAEAYAELQRLLADELPILPLVTPTAVYPYTERATGLFFDEASSEVGLLRFTQARLDQPDD